jgi:hypothetical protein
VHTRNPRLPRGLPDREPTCTFVEHESGPELLVFVSLTTAGISLAKSAIDLVVAILKARSDGVRKGDRPTDAVEVIVRRVTGGTPVQEEIALVRRLRLRDPAGIMVQDPIPECWFECPEPGCGYRMALADEK